MMNKPKYMRRVFSGKTIPMIGLDQGKSKLYRGDGVLSVVNMMYDGSLRTRCGQTLLYSVDGGITSAGTTRSGTFLCEGNNIWIDQ